MPKLRVGIGDILDARPLAWGFLKGHHADLFSPQTHPLPLVGRLLAQGGLDAALMPATEVARYQGLRVLPDLCVAFPGETRTLVLLSDVPVPEIRRVYLGRSARTSAVALRAVLSEGRGIEPEYLEQDPPKAGGAGGFRLEPGEAVLLIGGAALAFAERDGLDRRSAVRSPRPRRLDLGAAWRELTGVPLVVGVWAVRPGATLPDLPFYFKSSLRYGLSSLDAIAREAAAELGVDSREIARYLHEEVSYFLQEPELRGLEELLRRSARYGLAPEGAALRFWP